LIQRVCRSVFCFRASLYGHVTQAKTLFEAVSTALDWFQSDFWRGPRPAREMIFEVGLVPDGRWFVRAEAVERWQKREASGCAPVRNVKD
jgi:hypothetical protein